MKYKVVGITDYAKNTLLIEDKESLEKLIGTECTGS